MAQASQKTQRESARHSASAKERRTRRAEHEAKTGMGLGVRFALSMSLSIAVVMLFGGLLLYSISTSTLLEELKVSGVGAARNLSVWPLEWSPDGPEEIRGETSVLPVRYKVEGIDQRGFLYRQPKRDSEGRVIGRADILIPEERFEKLQADLLLLVFIISMLLIAVTSFVAWFVAKKIAAPLTHLVGDIETISQGNLEHKTRVHGGGAEIGSLALAVDRMTEGLKSARETELELQKQEHDLAIASEVRQNLLPDKIAQIPGYELAGTHKASADVGGDYYDVIPIENSARVALLVAEVAGKGVPAALVMTMARAYLRSELQRYPDPAEAFAAANRALARDMRRGMYVTALCAVLDTKTGSVSIVSAGHKVPLLHWSAKEDQLKALTPPGIALGFDKGPVFERTLKKQELSLAAGDRITLCTSGPISAKNKQGEEFGEKSFYTLIKREAGKNSDAFLNRVLYGVEIFTEEGSLSADIALVTAKRGMS